MDRTAADRLRGGNPRVKVLPLTVITPIQYRDPMGRMPISHTNVVPTQGELLILQAIWKIGEGTIDQIVAASEQHPSPNYKTTQAMLRIMEQKNLVAHRTEGRAFIYRPKVDRDKVNRGTIRSLLARNFGGSRTELLINLIEDETLSEGELKDLEELIRRYRREMGGE